jgi:hypothetical protein
MNTTGLEEVLAAREFAILLMNTMLSEDALAARDLSSWSAVKDLPLWRN